MKIIIIYMFKQNQNNYIISNIAPSSCNIRKTVLIPIYSTYFIVIVQLHLFNILSLKLLLINLRSIKWI